MRKQHRQPSFATLTDAEMDQLIHSLDKETYAAIRLRVNKPRSEGGLGLNLLSDRPLERLWQKTKTVEKINAHLASGEKLTVAAFDAITQGDIPASEEVHDAIMTATYIRVTESDNTPHQLLALQRLADFPARVALRDERMELDLAKFQHKVAMDEFRKQTTKARLALAQQSLRLRRLNPNLTLNPNLPNGETDPNPNPVNHVNPVQNPNPENPAEEPSSEQNSKLNENSKLAEPSASSSTQHSAPSTQNSPPSDPSDDPFLYFEGLLNGTIKPSWIPAEIPCDDEETFLDVWLRKRRARLAASAPHNANPPAGQEAIIQPRTHKDSSFPSIEPIPPANV